MTKIIVVQKYIDKALNRQECIQSLECSKRTFQRYVHKFRSLGVSGLRHGLCGKKSNNTSGYKLDSLRKYAEQKRYEGFGPTLLAEILTDTLGRNTINHETLRRSMIRRGIRTAEKGDKKVTRIKRDRKEQFGVMEQFDGSYHVRIEGLGELCLLCSIDDATSKIKLIFTEGESLIDVLKFRFEYFKEYGKPGSIYVDRHATYKVNHPQDIFDRELRTRFQKGMKKLGIVVIYAREPQGKGRVERGFGTHQDRLVKLMKLAGITTKQEANDYLKDIYISQHNKKFGVKAKTEGDYHSRMTEQEETEFKWYFAQESERVIKHDGTISYSNSIYQIAKGTILVNQRKIKVLESLDGEIRLFSNDKQLHYTKK